MTAALQENQGYGVVLIEGGALMKPKSIIPDCSISSRNTCCFPAHAQQEPTQIAILRIMIHLSERNLINQLMINNNIERKALKFTAGELRIYVCLIGHNKQDLIELDKIPPAG